MSIFTSSAGSSIIQDYKSYPPSILLLTSKQSSQSLCQKYKPYYMPQRRQTKNIHQQSPDPQLLQISRDLDIEYLELKDHIIASAYFGTASKHLRIRLDNWLSKLDTIIANITWKRNRNNYAKLIDLMCECQTVVEPFTALPPQGDVPKMNKHQINRIIDEVQRQVKLQKMQSRGSEEANMFKNSQVKPNEFWSRVKSEREFGAKGSFISDQSSMILAKSTLNGDSRVESKKIDLVFNHKSESSKKSAKIKYQFSSEDAISNSSKDKQNFIEPNKFYITNNSNGNAQIPQIRSKPFQKAPKHLSVKLNTELHKVQLIRSPLFQAKISQQQVKYTENSNIDNLSNKNSRLQAFRDQHISFQYENQTLKTQYFDQDLSLNPQKIQDLSFFSTDQCDFTDQLSERCRQKQGVLSQQYFGWRKSQEEELQIQQVNFPRVDTKASQLAYVPRKLMVKASAIKILPTYHQNHQLQMSYQQQVLDEPDQIFNGANSFSIISDHQYQEQLKTNEKQVDNVHAIA